MMKKGFVLLLILTLLSAPALAYNPDAVVDDAGLLSSSQETELENTLAALYETYDFQVVLHTTEDTGYRDLAMYAADFYDENGYGWGSGYDGLILVVDMDAREYVTVTTGSGMALFSDYDIGWIENAMLEDLSAGYYARAFQTYLTYAERFLKNGGNAYYYSNTYDSYEDDDFDFE